MPIRCRLPVLIGEWEMNNGASLSFAELSRQTGVGEKTLRQWARNQTQRYDARTMEALCRFFNCGVGDLLVYTESDG